MTYVLDTNVVSALRVPWRNRPSRGWVDSGLAPPEAYHGVTGYQPGR